VHFLIWFLQGDHPVIAYVERCEHCGGGGRWIAVNRSGLIENYTGPQFTRDQSTIGRLTVRLDDNAAAVDYLSVCSVRWAVSILFALPEPYEFIRVFIAEGLNFVTPQRISTAPSLDNTSSE